MGLDLVGSEDLGSHDALRGYQKSGYALSGVQPAACMPSGAAGTARHCDRAPPPPPMLPQVIDTDTYEVVVVSPRNHFVFTPMLPR